jgi:hypothetical protein
MRRTGYVGIAVLLGIVLSGASGIRADDAQDNDSRHFRKCSVATLRGDYGIQIQGTRPSGPGGPMESVVGVVIRTYDGKGTFEQTDNVHGSISGTVPDRPGFGTYVVNADCTGVAYLQLPGPPFAIEERLVIVDNGLELSSATMNPPPVMVTGVHHKIHHN